MYHIINMGLHNQNYILLGVSFRSKNIWGLHEFTGLPDLHNTVKIGKKFKNLNNFQLISIKFWRNVHFTNLYFLIFEKVINFLEKNNKKTYNFFKKYFFNKLNRASIEISEMYFPSKVYANRLKIGQVIEFLPIFTVLRPC